ncbi:hypothetical protein WJX81_003791 [Elliptochloris bilobata]|uniref:Ribosomal protein L13 n=1 Tax=Elliptochloris bilobata TaxID=381761 RepID=A0AAW1RV76_9CHLO
MSSKQLLRGVKTEGLRFRLVDAKEKVVGRLAAQIAVLLQGKDKPTFSPWKDTGDVVVVKNARHVEFTGRKWEQKVYRWHSGYPGGLKERPVRIQREKAPEEILRRAVYGMLPKNNLRKERARKLRIFPDEEHPFVGDPRLVPWEAPPRKLRVKEGLFEVPQGFEPLNADAYRKRYGHMLPDAAVEALRQEPSGEVVIPATATE